MYPIISLFLYITILLMVINWPAIYYPIKISFILGIWETKCLIPTTDTELTGGRRCTIYGYDPQTHQVLLIEKPHPHALHDHRVVVVPAGWNETLCHPDRGNWKSAGYDQQTHEHWIQLLWTQTQEPPLNSLYNHMYWTDSHMESLKINLRSGLPREIPIPKLSQLLHGIHWNKQPGGTDNFWHIYAGHTLGFRVH